MSELSEIIITLQEAQRELSIVKHSLQEIQDYIDLLRSSDGLGVKEIEIMDIIESHLTPDLL